METRPIKKVIILIAGILVAYLIASTLANTVVIYFHLFGPAGLIISSIVFAVIIFTVLDLLQKYTHIIIFEFGLD